MATRNLSRRLLRAVPLSQAPPTLTTSIRGLSTSQRLLATGSVSNQPGSKTFTELGKNAKEEASKLTDDVAKTIAGANDRTSQQPDGGSTVEHVKNDLTSMASTMAEQIPNSAMLGGAAGLLPYAGTSLATIYLSRQAGAAVESGASSLDAETALALLHYVEMIQIQYGAIILSFLGAMHWGFEFAGFGGHHVRRYYLGIAPVLLGWGSLLLPGQIALVGQWAAFAGLWWADQKATAAGWAPKWYSSYRFWLTAVVGSSILLTLGASNYYGPGDATFAAASHRLAEVSPDIKVDKKGASLTAGDMKVEKADDAFVKFTNLEKVREEEKKKEEEKRKEEDKAASKDKAEAEKRRKEALQK